MAKNDYIYKLQAIHAAKDLGYSKSVIVALRSATTANEITRIMCNARHATCN